LYCYIIKEETQGVLEEFFNPNGVAIIGASGDASRGGYYLVKNALAGYRGELFLVNPKYEEIMGVKCYPDVRSIPGNFEMAVYFIPAKFLPETIRECSRKGVKAIIIESAGFSETGGVGRALQEESLALARRYGIRLWGPNCMGYLDGHSLVAFSFMHLDEWTPYISAGNVSFIVQSGMLSAGFLIMVLGRGGMGIRRACSIGNKCDVDETELLEYFVNDRYTGVIGCYLESIIDGRRFLDLAAGTHKPVVVLKSGRSEIGARAVLSHTASLSGSGAVYEGAFRQAGIVQVFDLHELMDLARGFSLTESFSPAAGTAVITFSGGAAIVTADLLADMGVTLARFSPETIGSLRKIFPAWAETANPLDLWPAVEAGGFQPVYIAATEAILSDPAVDSVVIELFARPEGDFGYMEKIGSLVKKYAKPVAIWAIGIGSALDRFTAASERVGLPIFAEIRRCAEFLAGVRTHYHKMKKH
jgi:acyl-CoA synthetase (NDP forming)